MTIYDGGSITSPIQYYSPTVTNDKTFVLDFGKWNRLDLVIHKMQKSKTKVLPGVTVGE